MARAYHNTFETRYWWNADVYFNILKYWRTQSTLKRSVLFIIAIRREKSGRCLMGYIWTRRDGPKSVNTSGAPLSNPDRVIMNRDGMSNGIEEIIFYYDFLFIFHGCQTPII